MQELRVRWTGIRPLLMSNGIMADPLHPMTRERKKITGKGSKKMTDADYEQLRVLDWTGAAYWDDEVGLFVPNDNIERCIQQGAMKQKKGKDVQAAVFVGDEIVPIKHCGPKDRDKLVNDPRFSLRKGVVRQRTRVLITRPMIPTGWSCEFTVEYDESVIQNAELLMSAMVDAGSLVGIGDWRPKFGRFTVEAI